MPSKEGNAIEGNRVEDLGGFGTCGGDEESGFSEGSVGCGRNLPILSRIVSWGAKGPVALVDSVVDRSSNDANLLSSSDNLGIGEPCVNLGAKTNQMQTGNQRNQKEQMPTLEPRAIGTMALGDGCTN